MQDLYGRRVILGDGMRVWVGTGKDRESVYIFFEKPDLRGEDIWVNGQAESPRYWLEGGIPVSRREAAPEFGALPRHGTTELYEFKVDGERRLRI